MAKRSPLTFNTETVPFIKKEERLHENTQTTKRTNKKSRDGRKFIAAHVSVETIKQIGMLAVQHSRTKQDILVEALNDLFAKYGLSRIADE